MKYARLLLFFVVALSLGAAVSALSCDYDEYPLIVSTSRPAALCYLDDALNSDCFTYLSDPANSSDIWGVMPGSASVEGVGRVDYFRASNGVARVEFDTSGLYHNVTALAVVVCEDETTSFNITPVFADYQELGEAWLYANNNSEFLVFLSLTIIFLIGLVVMIKKL